MTEGPTRTEQNKLIDDIRRQLTFVEGEMAEGEWEQAVASCERFALLAEDLRTMTAAGYDFTSR